MMWQLILGCLLLSPLPSADAPNREKEIKQHAAEILKGKVLVMQQSPAGQQLRFGTEGHLVDEKQAALPGVPTPVLLSKVEVKSSRLRLQVQPLVNFYDQWGERYVVPAGRESIEVALSPGPEWKSQLHTALTRVFFTSTGPKPEAPPPLPGVNGNLEFRWRGEDVEYRPVGESNWKRARESEQPLQIGAVGKEPVYVLSKGMQTGKPVHTQDPEYPAELRGRPKPGRVRFAVAVGSDGTVRSMRALASTDPAFTRSAAAALSQWRFEPVRLEGRPVAVLLNIEIDFQL